LVDTWVPALQRIYTFSLSYTCGCRGDVFLNLLYCYSFGPTSKAPDSWTLQRRNIQDLKRIGKAVITDKKTFKMFQFSVSSAYWLRFRNEMPWVKYCAPFTYVLQMFKNIRNRIFFIICKWYVRVIFVSHMKEWISIHQEHT
jgi:hypothetical protein